MPTVPSAKKPAASKSSPQLESKSEPTSKQPAKGSSKPNGQASKLGASSAPPKSTAPAKQPSSASASKEDKGASKLGKGGKTKKAPPLAPREIIYDKYVTGLLVGDKALTGTLARKLLGAGPAHEGAKEGVFQLGEEKLFLSNNVRNRPLYSREALIQDILRKNWKFNGEPIIIGKTGLILNGQHTLLALLEAIVIWKENPGHWKDWWQAEPTLEKAIVYGVSEEDAVVNTMDTCKPRTLKDVIYSSPLFKDLQAKGRRDCSRMTEYAIKLLWQRLGINKDAYRPTRTHAEAMAFLQGHPRVLQAVKHVYQEDGSDRKVGNYISSGTMAGMMYLMAISGSDRSTDEKTGYFDVQDATEKQLNFALWDKACEFVVEFAGMVKGLNPLRQAFLDLEGSGTMAEKEGLLALAWCEYADGKPVTKSAVTLQYATDEDGSKHLEENPLVGEIDLGP